MFSRDKVLKNAANRAEEFEEKLGKRYLESTSPQNFKPNFPH
jgi:hypothetical protein